MVYDIFPLATLCPLATAASSLIGLNIFVVGGSLDSVKIF